MDDITTTAWDFPTRDHSQFDPFVFIILSHGDSNDAIFSVDHSLMPSKLAGMWGSKKVPPVCSELASERSWAPLLQINSRSFRVTLVSTSPLVSSEGLWGEKLPGSLLITCLIHLHCLHIMMVSMLSMVPMVPMLLVVGDGLRPENLQDCFKVRGVKVEQFVEIAFSQPPEFWAVQ